MFVNNINSLLDRNHYSFFQLQVWKSEGTHQSLFKSNESDDNSPSLRLEKLGINKNRIYCTIDCDKGLKVQKLYLVGIFKLKNVFYISDNTFFPPPSSKRKHGISDMPITDDIPKIISIPPHHDMWNSLGDVMEEFSKNGRTSFYHLTRSVEFAADIDGREVYASKLDLRDWLKMGVLTLEDKIRYGVIDDILEVWVRGFFFSTISSATSTRLLTEIFNKTGEGHFLIRLSLTRGPYFDLEGFYADHTTGEPTFYKALIMYDFDQTSKKVVYWIDTRNDSKASRSLSLLNVISYISLTTRWKPLSADFYDKNGLPTYTFHPVINTTINSSSSSNEVTSSSVTSINSPYYQLPSLPSPHVNKSDTMRGWPPQ